MKNKVKKMMAAGVTAFMYSLIFLQNQTAFAKEDDKSKDVSEITNGIDTIKTIVLACVGGVGVVFLAWGLLDFGTAYSAHDTTQQSQAIKKVIGGLIMVAVPSILTLLGV